MTTNVYIGLTIVFFFMLVGLLIAIIITCRHGMKTQLEKYKWLHEIAEQQKREINQYVMAQLYYVSDSDLRGTVPYLDFHFSIYNASVYIVSIDDTVKGSIYFKSQPLSKEVKITENSARHCAPYNPSAFTIRQWLSPEEAEHILNSLSDDDLFGINQLEITIKGGGIHANEILPQRLGLPTMATNKGLKEKYAKPNA